MVFSSYSNTSYLPLDSDQSVTFYKNENLLFPPPPAASAAAALVSSPSTLVCRRNSAAAAAMLTATTGSSPFGSQSLRHGSQQGTVCDDFQPVAHLSSNGYYGYVPYNSIPKMMSTDTTPPAAVATNDNGVGVLLDCHPMAASVVDNSSSTMMDCGGGIGGVENYHHLQQQHLRKRKEYSEEMEVNCKRRKTWLEQPTDADPNLLPNWTPAQQMECNDQPMDTVSALQHFNGSPMTMNASTTTTITFNGFQQHSSPPMPATLQSHSILQPKNRLFGVCSPTSKPLLIGSKLAEKPTHSQIRSNRFGDNCQELEDLFISLHGSGFYLSC